MECNVLTQEQMQEFEQRLSASEHSVADLCREAGVAQTTWGRWKRGEFHPSFVKARDVIGAIDKLAPAKEGVQQ